MAKKQKSAHSLRHAIELCLDHARNHKRLSVDRVADQLGLANKWTLYKWMESGRLPATLIRPLESVCGTDCITRYLALSAHKLIIDMPRGNTAQESEINDTQAAFAAALTALIEYYRGRCDTETTLTELHDVMARLAGHREHVLAHAEPELDLFRSEEDSV